MSELCAHCGAPVKPNKYRKPPIRFCGNACRIAYRFARANDPAHIAERFARFVDTAGPVPSHRPELGPCHVWTGAIGSKGYGLFTIGKDRRNLKAHRVAFFVAEGRWPEPAALHRCDNRACVRRDHLFEGTQVDNLADMRAKGRAAPMPRPYRERRGVT